MKENKRKCLKCGGSPAEDPSITLYRFPKPGKTNIVRSELWAKFCFPKETWSSVEFQMKLYLEHRMLCHKHFKETEFSDFGTKKLHRHAVPYEECEEMVTEMSTPSSSKSIPVRLEPTPGPSHRYEPLSTITNLVQSPVHQQISSTSVPESSNIFEPSIAQVVPIQEKVKFKTTKEKYYYLKCRKNMKDICRLRQRICKLKNQLHELNNDESVNEIFKNKMTPSFALLFQSQLKNFKKKSKGRRWSTDDKILALRLYKRSPTCYRLLRRLFCLPAPSTLKTVLNTFPLHVGINDQIFNVLKKFVNKQKTEDNHYILTFDEMSIKKNLFYNKKQDLIEGYQDHASQGRSPQTASHALVFMICGIRKKVKQPIAYYFSSGYVTADRLAILIKEVLHHCFETGVKISATVCDLDGVNKRALNILGASVEHPYMTHHNQEVVTLFDPPHLLKCFRNLFLKYDIECPTNIESDGKVGIGIAKWSHIKQFYEQDNNNPNFVFAPALKKEHLDPNTKQKMKVKLAAQTLSHTVAAGMYAKISQGELPAAAAVTAEVISNMDKLFDCLNADSADLRRGKPYATNLKNNTLHLNHFKAMKIFFRVMKFKEARSRPPSQDGWVQTINGVERLWRTLSKDQNIKSLATRRLQQDPLENCFGCVRANCGSNTNPTAGQFVAGLKTAILSNMSHLGVGNCEHDDNVILDNFKTLLAPVPTKDTDTEVNDSRSMLLHLQDKIESTFEESVHESGEHQACAYVCGFILKNHNNECETCKKILSTNQKDVVHTFVDYKEYSEIKRSLFYASNEFILCVERCATLINTFLATEAHTTNLKVKLKKIMMETVKFDFLNSCESHRAKNIEYIIDSTFYICIKRFCCLKNRAFQEEASTKLLKKKIDILKHV